MRLARLYSNVAHAAATGLLVASCAGCWEKIEYTGRRTTGSTPSAAPTEERPTGKRAESPLSSSVAEKQADNTPIESPSTPSLPSTKPATQASESQIPKQVDDLYANTTTPENKSSAVASPSQSSPTNETSAATVGDRYTTSGPASTPLGDSLPTTPSPENSTSGAAPNPYAQDTPPDAPPVAGTPLASNPMTSTRAAWLLGSRLSLAALAHDRGVAAKNVPVWFGDATSAATFLGTTIGDLPEPATANDASPASRQAINYLLVNGQRLGRDLAKQHGAEQSAIFEIALKSNLLLLLYTPGASSGDSIATAISKAAPQAKLPTELWQPLVDALKNKLSQADVRSAVRKMHGEIERYLSQPGEQRGK